MYLSSIGDGGVHNVGGGVLRQCGVYNGSNPSLFGHRFCGPAFFITRADELLRVLIVYYAYGSPPLTRLYTDMTKCYVRRLY